MVPSSCPLPNPANKRAPLPILRVRQSESSAVVHNHALIASQSAFLSRPTAAIRNSLQNMEAAYNTQLGATAFYAWMHIQTPTAHTGLMYDTATGTYTWCATPPGATSAPGFSTATAPTSPTAARWPPPMSCLRRLWLLAWPSEPPTATSAASWACSTIRVCVTQ